MMDDIEIRKTRLDFVWKVLAVCITVLGAAIVYFGQNSITIPTAGEIVFIGVEALCSLLLLVGIKYLYCDAKLLCDDNCEKHKDKKGDIGIAYNDIFFAAKTASIYLAFYSICLVVHCMYGFKWLQFFVPTQQHVFIIATTSFVFLIIPSNRVWTFSSNKVCTAKESPNMPKGLLSCKQISIETNKLKNCRWAFYSAFLFNFWYLISFVIRGV